MTELVDIAGELAKPFAVEDIDLLPKGKMERDGKTFCMALPYADPRVYQDRLNSLVPGEWSTSVPIALEAGSKLITFVMVTICGVSHTDVGEAQASSENAGTEAYAQALKRAISQFGLGRYLYDLEKEWVPFNPQAKRIELDKAACRAIVKKMYQKAGIAVPGTAEPPKSKAASNGHQAEPEVEIERHLQVYKSLFSAWCAKTKNWQMVIVRDALGIGRSEPYPTAFSADDALRIGLYVAQKKQEAGKATPGGKEG